MLHGHLSTLKFSTHPSEVTPIVSHSTGVPGGIVTVIYVAQLKKREGGSLVIAALETLLCRHLLAQMPGCMRICQEVGAEQPLPDSWVHRCISSPRHPGAQQASRFLGNCSVAVEAHSFRGARESCDPDPKPQALKAFL